MYKITKIATTILLFLSSNLAFSQAAKTLTLQECINQAVSNNLQIRQSKFQIEENFNKLEGSKYNRLPNANGSLNQNLSSGRVIDPFTNSIINQKTNYQNLGINSSVVIFEGGILRNTIRLNELQKTTSEQQLAATEEALKLKVIEAFFQVLNAQEQLGIVNKQFENSKFQLKRIENLMREGIASKATLLDLQAQMAGEELGVSTAESNLEFAKTILLQTMNDKSLGIELDSKGIVPPKIEVYNSPFNTILQNAFGTQSIIDIAKTNVKISKIGIDLAAANNKPSVFGNLNFGSNYSSAAPDQRFVADGKPSNFVENKSTDFVLVNGQKQNITRLVEIPSGSYQKLGYFNQLDYNLNLIYGFSVRVPIFNGFDTKIKVQQANLAKLKAENQLNITETDLKNTVELAYKNMQSAFRKYGLTTKQLSALEAAFDLTKKKFEEGNLSSLEYTLAKNNVDKVKLGLIQAKFEYIFRTKVLDFYADKL